MIHDCHFVPVKADWIFVVLAKVAEFNMMPYGFHFYKNFVDKAGGDSNWLRKPESNVIVFTGNYYGIFHLMEFTVLSRLRLRHLEKELGTIKAPT